ncbi:hypothetical protein VOI54_04215 [Tamlana sp. 2201CG12-4]|uniref:hypothetical protein n=1 Tax=Tamlana sp. 2201CG12-4 TaxID=3112582 RepID=UPI002DB674A0|nr:hypothetical protein [Tamlana sp. 2201CG12-4]MEC3906209.1 hypothetical protein [Tamlana sp. 2201CG12-4]
MKKHLLILLLSLSFLVSNSQSQDNGKNESYILTTKGKKINIIPNEDIYYNRFSIDYVKKAGFYGKKKKVDGIGYVRKNYKTFSSIKTKNIDKIVDGNRLYLPFIDDKKIKVFRYIAKNKDYILGSYILNFSTSTPSSISASGEISTAVHSWRYVILDHSYNLIKEGEVYGVNNEEIEKSLAEIKKIFGECLGRNDNLMDFIASDAIEPDENFSIEKLRENKKYSKYILPKFLYYLNQIECN